MSDLGSPGGVTGAGGTGTPGPSPSGGSPSPSPSSPGPSSSSAGTSTGPGTSGSDAPLPEGQPVPYDRFKTVNERANRLAWAESHDPGEVEEATKLWRWFDQDPQGAYDYLTGAMRRGGHLPPAAPAPQPGSTPRFTDPSTGRPLPDVIIQETGQKFYSAEQADKLTDWKAAQLEERIKAIEGSSLQTQTQQQARAMLAEAERWEGFRESAQEIYDAMRKDKRLSLEGAYRRVVVPRLGQIARAAVIREMQGKADGGSGALNPGSPGPQSTEELRKLPIKELFRREMSRRGLGR